VILEENVKKVRLFMLEWICEKTLLKFVSDMMIVRRFLIF